MQIKRMDGQTITTSTKPSDITYIDRYDSKFVATGNRVVDMPETVASGFIADTVFKGSITTATSATGRSSIKYSNS